MKKLTKQILKEMVLVELSSVDLLNENAATEFKDTKDAWNEVANDAYEDARGAFAEGQGDIQEAINIMSRMFTGTLFKNYEGQTWIEGGWKQKEWTPKLKRSFERMKRKWARFAKKKIKTAKKVLDKKELSDSLDTYGKIQDELANCGEEGACSAEKVAELENDKKNIESDVALLRTRVRGKRRIGLRRKHAFPTAADFKKLGGTVFKNFEDFYAEVAKNPEAAKALCRFRDGKCRLRKGGRDKRWGRSHWEAWGILEKPKVTAAEPAVAAEPAAGTRRKREPLATAKKNFNFSEFDKHLATATADQLKMFLRKLKTMKSKGTRPENTEYLNALIKHIEKKWNEKPIPTADVKGDTTFDK